MEDKTKQAEKAILMEVERNSLGHLQLKLGMLSPEMPIEKQIQSLSEYHDIPDVESIKNGETQLQEGYIKDFFIGQVKQYFSKFPEAYDLIGEKYDDLMLNYATLGIKYRLLGSRENDKNFRQKAIRAYYEYLPKYEQFLLNHIQRTGNYQLTQSTPEGLHAYIELERQHEMILNEFGNPLSCGKLINAVMVKLFPKIKDLKETGISDYYYNRAVSDMIIGKFKAYRFLILDMTKGGVIDLQQIIDPISEPLGINGVVEKLSEAEKSLDFDEKLKKEVADLKSYLEALQKNDNDQNDNSGCFGSLLLLATAATGLIASLIIIL